MAMKLSSPLIAIAGAVLLTAFASSRVSAQRANVPGALNQVPRQSPQWSPTDVSTARPFGHIDVAAAGSSVESVRLWTLGRSVSERYEINGRCAVIQKNPVRYSPSDQQFCQNYAVAGFARPVTPRS
jgi:hypothetical protein